LLSTTVEAQTHGWEVHLFWSFWCDQVKVTPDLRLRIKPPDES
jgi:hypothetical protein